MRNKHQAQGLNFSRAVAIVFLMNELEQFFYYEKQIENIGQDKEIKVNTRIDILNKFFPATFCVFEKIDIQRYVFFFIFNIACLISEINTVNMDATYFAQI